MARELGGLLGLTPMYLDGLYYDRNWRPLEQEQFAAVQRELISASRWIIDGNYASTLPIRLQAADTVIFLDLPAWACLWGVVQRRLRHGGGQHDAIGVYDRVTWNFVWYIARYRRRMAPRVRQLIVAQATHLERLSGRMDEFARLEALQHDVQAEIGQFRAADRLGRDEVHDRAVH